MIRYKAITAAHDEETGALIYNGKTYGVRFDQGIAWFDDMTVDQKIGLTAAEIARRMRVDFGYHIERYNPDGTPYKEGEEIEKAQAKAAREKEEFVADRFEPATLPAEAAKKARKPAARQ